MTDRVYQRRFSENTLFWALFAALYTAICWYIFEKLRSADSEGRAAVIWLLLCAAMTGLPYLARRTKRLRRAEQRRLADIAGGLWGLFVAIAFLMLAGLDQARLVFAPEVSAWLPIAAAVLLSSAAVACGVKQANTIQTTKLKLKTDKLPEGERLRIVQLTDLHLGPYSGARLLAQILRRVREAKPDLVVVTGDLADGSLEGRERETAMFRRIRPRCGIFAVPGNHDYYDDIGGSVAFMEKCGMRVLRGEAAEAGGIVIAGADDRDHMRMDKWNLTRSQTLIVNTRSRCRGKFLLLLRHRPVVEPGTDGMFDLQLSGHTHGGQLLPLFSSRLKLVHHPRGIKRLRYGSRLYVSNGAGYVGPPVRFLAPPEVVVLDLIGEGR